MKTRTRHQPATNQRTSISILRFVAAFLFLTLDFIIFLYRAYISQKKKIGKKMWDYFSDSIDAEWFANFIVNSNATSIDNNIFRFDRIFRENVFSI